MTLTALVLAALALALAPAVGAGQLTPDEQRALRERVTERYDVVPLSEGLALRPKRRGEIRLIEITDGSIAINGTIVTGQELRARAGNDADLLLRLSYMRADDQRALFAEPKREVDPEKPAEPALEATGPESDPPRRPNRMYGDRVRVFGDVVVGRDEEIVGEVVAVFGSVKIDGEVRQEVVSVFGSVELGPEAVVDGDIVSVGGRVNKAPGARTRRGTSEISATEISIGNPDFRMHMPAWFRGWGGPLYWFGGEFGALPRLIGTMMRFGLILLVAGIALLIARPSVEGAAERVADSPLKAMLVGLTAQLLILPVLLLTGLVLVITVIGIPLLLLLPFVVLLLAVMAVVGFTGTAAAIGGAVLRRAGSASPAPFFEIVVGVLIILLPLLIGRMLAVAGWTLTPIAVLFVALGFIVELLAWSSGFGAALTNSFTRWRARRIARRNGVTIAPAQ
jgi:hypothetical protein